MLLTFHTDFSNEESGAIMFYKGFRAYYQAVGKLCLRGALLLGLSRKGNFESKGAQCLAFLVSPLKRRGLSNLDCALTGQFPGSIREARMAWQPGMELSLGLW